MSRKGIPDQIRFEQLGAMLASIGVHADYAKVVEVHATVTEVILICHRLDEHGRPVWGDDGQIVREAHVVKVVSE